MKPKKLVRLAYKDVGLDYYGNGIVATEQTIKENPAILKAFVRATLKGMRDAFADPAEAGEILHKYHKEISPEVAQGETELVRELAVVPGHAWVSSIEAKDHAHDRHHEKVVSDEESRSSRRTCTSQALWNDGFRRLRLHGIVCGSGSDQAGARHRTCRRHQNFAAASRP